MAIERVMVVEHPRLVLAVCVAFVYLAPDAERRCACFGHGAYEQCTVSVGVGVEGKGGVSYVAVGEERSALVNGGCLPCLSAVVGAEHRSLGVICVEAHRVGGYKACHVSAGALLCPLVAVCRCHHRAMLAYEERVVLHHCRAISVSGERMVKVGCGSMPCLVAVRTEDRRNVAVGSEEEASCDTCCGGHREALHARYGAGKWCGIGQFGPIKLIRRFLMYVYAHLILAHGGTRETVYLQLSGFRKVE